MTDSTGDEAGLVLEAVEQLLTTTAAITGFSTGAHFQVAPVQSTYPFLVYSIQSMEDLEVLGGVRVWTNVDVLVKGYAGGPRPSDDLRSLSKAVDTAFGTMSYQTTGGVVIRGRRLRPYAAQEQYDDGPVNALGGVYKVFSQST